MKNDAVRIENDASKNRDRIQEDAKKNRDRKKKKRMKLKTRKPVVHSLGIQRRRQGLT
jgi:hypothetical protein